MRQGEVGVRGVCGGGSGGGTAAWIMVGAG